MRGRLPDDPGIDRCFDWIKRKARLFPADEKHFLAHARRSRNNRTFSEDDRIQAQENAKKIEDGDESDVSEPEDPMMLQSQAKDWKVRRSPPLPSTNTSPFVHSIADP